MLLHHRDLPDRSVRLGYCTNVHPGDDTFGAVLEGLESVTLELRDRLAPGRLFGVGMYLPADVALSMAEGNDNREREYLAGFLGDEGLDAFTWNAFPFGGFHGERVKENVFLPAWSDPERVMYTAACANLATLFAGPPTPGRHLSISTHTGMHASQRASCDEGLAHQALVLMSEGLAGLEDASEWRCVLGLEAEPRANCNDTGELAELVRDLHQRHADELDVLTRHLGTCLDACHAAVEFEPAETALAQATAGGTPLSKLQLTSALALPDPAGHDAARERLFAMAEERYLHQVTARAPDGSLTHADDLPDAEARWNAGDPAWREAAEWRCHFHVPLDREALGDEGLITTRDAASAQLTAALSQPERWGSEELHVELETYTWDVLPEAARGPGALVDALEREYRYALELCAQQGWEPA